MWPRIFSLDRIKYLHVKDETFDMPKDWSAKEFFDGCFGIITFNLRPEFDFQQELLWNGEDMEVLEPLWLRKEIAWKIKRMLNKYSNDVVNVECKM